jgi:hypothetical protein
MKPETVTASEIADFVFRKETWRLCESGYESGNKPIRDAGSAHHQDKATAEVIAGGSIAIC